MKKLALVYASLILVGCSSSGAPDCSDSDVMEIVENIFEKKLVDTISISLSRKKYEEFKYMADNASDIAKEAGMVKSFEALEDSIDTIEYSIDGIRTQSKNDNIRKSHCEANVAFQYDAPVSGNEVKSEGINFTYTAQYTDDGSQIYVEASGL